MKKDHMKEIEKLQRQIEREDAELLKMLEQDEEDAEEDDDEEYEDEEYTPFDYKSLIPAQAPEEPKPKLNPVMWICTIIFFLSLLYTFCKFIYNNELHLVPLAVTIISFTIVEVMGWKRRKK